VGESARITRRVPVAAGVLCFGVLALMTSCGAEPDPTVFIPVVSKGASKARHIEYMHSAAIDSTRLALTWVDTPEKGQSRIWFAELQRRSDGRLKATGEPTRIDVGYAIPEAHVFADGDSFGLLYTQNGDLVCRRPWSGTPSYPLPLRGHHTITSAGLVRSDGTLFVVALVLGSGEDRRWRLLGLAIKGESVQIKVVGYVQRPMVRQQPIPQLSSLGDSIGVAFFLNSGSYSSADSPGDSVGHSSGVGGVLALFRLYTNEAGELQSSETSTATIPNQQDVALANAFSLLDPQGASIAVNRTRTYLIAPHADGEHVRRISSPHGSGAGDSRPLMQTIELSTDRQLIVWTDAVLGSSSELTDAFMTGRVASQFGADIHAAQVEGSEVDSVPVPGFPIRTNAQCITLCRLGGTPVLAWARASNHWTGDRRLPDRICVRTLGHPESLR
jgi:hypothetical protein